MEENNGNPPVENQAEQNANAEQPVSEEQPVSSEELSKDARMWGMFCHLAGLAGYVIPAFGWIIGPLVVWLIKKEEFPFVDEQGKEAMNFQISMFIYAVVAGLLCFACIGFVLLPAVAIVDLIFLIIAAVKANDGKHYRYPLTIRFIK